MDYYMSRRVSGTFSEIVDRIRLELKAEGFGVLTEIDVRSTLKKKLDVDYPNYIILGACNPPFAHKALMVEPPIGVLLPCNVVVRELPDQGIEVLAMDPVGAMAVVGRPEMSEIAQAVRSKIEAALNRLS
ncbi:MAG TPA: DUF302 domain-containing protein [Thermoanaerobaculia bacterium]|nr:DUF302 domain-containing protein [Thermoanaerobaculia bacterium]HUM29625.1 DUF302 domain-containing protein [Thermoanaerobaculia bacterium]HXK67276.1 DUF302 domain-containing protein [Thermoanaerobaculia bacterium]